MGAPSGAGDKTSLGGESPTAPFTGHPTGRGCCSSWKVNSGSKYVNAGALVGSRWQTEDAECLFFRRPLVRMRMTKRVEAEYTKQLLLDSLAVVVLMNNPRCDLVWV